MKDIIRITLLFALFMAAVPFAAAFISRCIGADVSETDIVVTDTSRISDSPPKNITDDISYSPFKVLCGGKVTEMPLREYVIGAVLAEMPAAYPAEALKAQAIAARTYAVRKADEQHISPAPQLMGAYISDDPALYQGYFTEAQARQFYGDSYDEAYSNAALAAEETEGMIITYNGEPIVAAFHALSCGMTESAENVWGSPVEYLTPADSSTDSSAPAFENRFSFTSKEIYGRLCAEYSDVNIPENAAELLEITERSPSGYVLKINAGGYELRGRDFARIFSLPSAAFELSPENDRISVITKGKGHGVGMSQYGAMKMAEDGSTYSDIIAHYYKGTEISHIKE